MGRGAWRATGHGVAIISGATEQLNACMDTIELQMGDPLTINTISRNPS